MKFDNKAMQRLYEDEKDAMEAVKQGKSAAQAASELYVRGLPDKDQQLGDVMAERVEEIVSQYEKLAKDALADPDGWIDACRTCNCEFWRLSTRQSRRSDRKSSTK